MNFRSLFILVHFSDTQQTSSNNLRTLTIQHIDTAEYCIETNDIDETVSCVTNGTTDFICFEFYKPYADNGDATPLVHKN